MLRAPLPPWIPAVLALVAGACSDAVHTVSDPGPDPGPFAVLDTSLADGVPVELNRAIDIVFNGAVDFSTVNSNTIRITASRAVDLSGAALAGGQPAVGTFELVTPDVVRFRPACPTGSGVAGAGLRPAEEYRLLVRGADRPGPLVHSFLGTPLAVSWVQGFRTPGSRDPAALYHDPVSGPPTVVIRPAGSQEEQATYLEVGRDDANRVYWSPELPGFYAAPINPYSVVEEQVAWVLQLDQPVDPSPDNLARVRLEGLDPPNGWVPLFTDVSVMANCLESGARLRLEPRGILPQASHVRARLAAGFRDLAGEALPADVEVAQALIATSTDPGTNQAGDDADQRFEDFVDRELRDPVAPPTGIPARWAQGRLEAAVNFAGTGGTNGEFDWYIPAGTDLVLNTSSDTIVGGPGGQPIYSQAVINGVVDVRDVWIPDTSRLIAIGPNPLTILATGTVLVEGEISVRGADNPGVATLNTTDQPEPGAPGWCGGGDGGAGSWRTDASTPRGQAGFGPYQVPAGGGGGGETSYALGDKNARRGAGGGGGRYGPDVRYPFQAFAPRCQTLVGLDVERGALGGPGGLGALSQDERAQGGAEGPGPFLDASPANDHFGRLQLTTGAILEGELDEPLPGAGGGAGGDASDTDTFPELPFDPHGDEKGAGGGGGGGLLRVLALGPIEVGPLGSLAAEGGDGGGGENVTFFDRVGGGSGGGSGGAIVLESLAFIEVRAVAPNAGPLYADDPKLSVHSPRPLSAVGGQGGAGNGNRGGANEQGPTVWRCDRIPLDHADGLEATLPPFDDVCYLTQPDIGDPEGGPTVGAGGDGGPGLIQLVVPDPAQNLRFPNAGGDLSRVCAPAPVGWDVPSGGYRGYLLPTMGPRSGARSKWIALGLARRDPSSMADQVELFFGGTDATGLVPTTGQGEVALEPPLVGPDLLQLPPAVPHVDPADPYTLVFDSAGIGGFEDVVERNPELLRGYTLRLSLQSQPDVRRDFTAVTGAYDPALDRLAVTVAADLGPLTDFQPGPDVQAELVPRSFQVLTGDTPDVLAAEVRVTFDATLADADGRPDETASWSAANGGFTGDVSQLNQTNWDFVRFQVEFDLGDDWLLQPRPALGHLRVPFRF